MVNDEFEIFRKPASEGNLNEDGKEFRTIMIVDDDSTVRQSLEITFKQHYRVIACANGYEAIEAISMEVYAVILDIRMPGMNGFEAFQKIKKKSPHVPILFYSAYQDLKDPYEVLNEYRPFGYVMKGSGFHLLMDSVRSAVEFFEQIQESRRMAEELRVINEELEQRIEQRTETIRQQKEQLEQQIDLARRIQQSLLPSQLPSIPHVGIAYRYIPVTAMGGDLVDIFHKESTSDLGLIICDVSGHGVPAAFISAMIKMSLGSWENHLKNPANLINWLQESLRPNIDDHFLTGIAAYLNIETGELTWASAGHPPALLLCADGSREYLRASGSAITQYKKGRYKNFTRRLERGDRVVFYTDGVSEVVGRQGSEITNDEFLSLFENLSTEPEILCSQVLERIDSFTGGNPENRFDDLTMLAIRFED